MWQLPNLFIAVCSLMAALITPSWADKRVALVIGNSAYRNVPPLANPVNDARLMADTLRVLGFTLVGDSAQLDLDKASFDNAVRAFGRELQGADVGLFYYAGHGMQIRGANFLVPVSANPTREADVDFELEDVSLILRQMEGARTKLNLVILDACRNNPFGGRGLRATRSGLAQMRAPEGTLISFATQPGNVAQDGADGNSPFTKALARTIRRPELGIFDAFNEVGLVVKRATGGSQQPWLSTSPIEGSFFFAARGLDETPKPSTTVPPAIFDGTWLTTISCPPAAGALGVSFRFAAQVKDGAFHGQRGADGQPGSLTLDGKVDSNGVVDLYASGIVNSSASAVGNVPKGTKYGYHITGRMNGSSGTGSRVEGRPCTVTFARQTP